jgi:hypothetical protein
MPGHVHRSLDGPVVGTLNILLTYLYNLTRRGFINARLYTYFPRDKSLITKITSPEGIYPWQSSALLTFTTSREL